jgi:hypothetical protein
VHNLCVSRSNNEALDASPCYRWSMLTADMVGLVGAAGGVKGAVKTGRALSRTGTSLGDVSARAISAARRRELAALMGLKLTRVGSRVINRSVRQSLLDGAGGVLGLYSSWDGGVIRELVVWIIGEDGQQA